MAPRPLNPSTPDVRSAAGAEVFEPEAPEVGVPFAGVSDLVSDSDSVSVSASVSVSVSEVDGNGGADVDGEVGVLSSALATGVGVTAAPPVVSCPVPSV